MPKFPDLLKNNNPNAPAVDLNDLQVKGVGIFADAAARDSLGVELHTEGYLAIMKDTDTPFIYTGGTWTDAANWSEVKGAWEEVAGTSTDIIYDSGRVGTRDLAAWNSSSGNVSNQLGSGFPGSGTRFHVHGRVGISMTKSGTDVYDEALRIVNDRHSSQTGIGIGPKGYGAEIRAYSTLNFTDASGNPTVNIANNLFGLSPQGAVSIGIGGISIPGNHVGHLTSNYKLSMAGPIVFKNHSSVVWNAIHQGPGTYSNAGVVIGTPVSGDVLYVRNGDVNTVGSFGYVGVNVNSPSATGPAFEVSSSYGKFNNSVRVEGEIRQDVNGDGRNNIHIGTASFTTNTSNNNILIGNNLTLEGNTTQNVLIGRNLVGGSPYKVTHIGTSGGGSVYIGSGNGGSSSQVAILGGANGSSSIGIGSSADTYGVAIGGNAGVESAVVGNSSNSSVGLNMQSILGRQVARFQSAGGSNVFIGWRNSYSADNVSNTVSIGREAGFQNVTGNANVFIGYKAGFNETGSNKLYIANSNTTTPLIYGDFDDGYVTINKNGTDKISFYAGSHAYQIADADYAGNYVSGAVSNNKGLYILFEGTGLEQSGTYRNGGLLIGRAWNFGADPGSVGNGVMLGNRLTATATSGNSWLPGVLIGNDVDLGSNNHAGGVLIGNVSPSGLAVGVTIHSGTGTKPSAGTANTVIINSTSGSSAIESVAIGGRAWGYNVSIGSQAQLNSTGNNPGVFIGRQAARYENGQLSTIVGYGAGYNINGGGNTALGASAAYGGASQGDSFSRYNTAVGASSLYSIFGGDENVAVGYRAGYSVTSGSNNVFVGKDAGYNVTTGAGNTIIGTNSLSNANLGSSNVIIGDLAGGTTYDGVQSVIIGRQANVAAGLTNARAVAIGYTANVSGSKGVAIGDSNAKGGAVAIGAASAGANDVAIGPGAGGNRANLSEFGHGTYIGYASGGSGTGTGIIIGGINAATGATISGSIGIGSYTFAGATDSGSVGIGAYAGRSSSGQRNMYLGTNAGWNTTGDSNVFLGYNNNITRTVSGSVHLGNLAGSQETTSNKLYIANSNTTTPLVYGEFDTPLLNVNGSLQVYGNPIYTAKYTSDTDTEVGNKNTASTGNTVHVEAYYTRAVDGDGYSESEYTGTGVRRIYYSNKFNADPTEIDSNENPEGWEVVDFVDLQVVSNDQGYGTHTFKSNTFDNTFAGSKTGVFDTIKTYEHLGQQCSIAVVVIPTKVNITTTGANEVFKFDLHTGDTDSTHNPYALCTVDWGDGSSTTAYAHQITGISNSVFIYDPATTVDGTSLTGVTYNDSIWDHTYATAGNYVITINGTTNGLTFKESTQITEINIGNQVRLGPRTFDTCTSLQTIKGRVFYENAKCRDNGSPLDHMLEGCSALTANHHLDHWFSPTNKVTTNDILTSYWSGAGPPANLDTLRFGKNIKVTYPQFANWRPTNGNIPYINFDWTEVTAVFARTATVNRLPMAEGLEPKAEQVINLNESFNGNATDLGPELIRMSKNRPFLNNFRRAFVGTAYSHYGTFRVSEASVWVGSAEIHGSGGAGSYYTTPGTFVPWFIVEGGYGNTGSSFTDSSAGRSFIQGDFDTDLSSMASIVGRYSNLSSALSSNYYFKGKGLENWDVSNVISFASTFIRSTRCNPDISRWDVSSAQNMNSMFWGATSFNSDIGDWDVRNVTDMTSMFNYAASFNQDISRWDTSSCLLASKMFTVADNGYWQGQTGAYRNNFNQDVGTKVAYRRGTSTTSEYTAWDVSSITTMEYMFSGYGSGYNSFNNGGSNSIQYWDTSSVTAMKFMFYYTRVFNQPLTSQTVTHTTLSDYTSWDVSNVTSFESVFEGALVFNQDLSSWTPTLVNTYLEMFKGAISFDGDLSGWITASSPVTSFNSMFTGASAFTGTGLDGWVMPTGQDFTCNIMFANCTVFNKDVSSWVMTRCTDMTGMFQNTIFNHDISGWDTSNVTSLKQMFYNNNSFNRDISSWSIASIPDGAQNTSDLMYSMFAAASGGITGLSAANLSAILVSWESQVAAGNGPINMRLGRIPSVTLTTAGQTAKDSLANSYGWLFT